MKTHYSGNASKKFWARINALDGKDHEYLYAMSCDLQNMEYRILRMLEAVEENKTDVKPE